MQTYIITINQPGEGEHPTIAHYIRRVEMPDVNAVIERLDAALKIKTRKPRSDAGQTRKPAN